MDISCFIKRIVPITLFNKGKASQLFSRASKGETLVVVKNNAAIAVILSPGEYELLQQFPKAYVKGIESRTATRYDELDALVDRLKSFDNGDNDV